jgi:hypothetical protein
VISMDDLKNHIETVLQAIANPQEKKRLRYGYGILLKALHQSGKELSSELLFSPGLTDFLESSLDLTRNASRARSAEIRKITSLLEVEGVLSPPADLFVDLGYPEDISLCRTRSLWKRFRLELIRKRLHPENVTTDWLVDLVQRLRTEGKLNCRLRYEDFRNEWVQWKLAHDLPIPDLPEWESRQDFYHLPWGSLPEHLREPLQTWLESSSRLGRSRKESTTKVYRNLLERYFGFRSAQGSVDSLSCSLADLMTAENIHQFLCWRRDRTKTAGSETWTGTLLWEAGAFVQLLDHLGCRDEAVQLRRWTADQDIESSRVVPQGPSFSELIQASEKLVRTAFSLAEGHVRDLAIRDALLFLEGILTGKSAHELGKRNVEDARNDCPPSVQGLLDHYLYQTRPRLLNGRKSQRLWIAQGGQPLTGVSIRTLLQKILNSQFSDQVTPKRIEEAWLAEYLKDHPNDILTPASHLTRNPLSVNTRKERIEQRSAIRRLDESLSGGYAK